MKLTDNIDEIIKNLSQSGYIFGSGELSVSEIRQIKKQSKDSRGVYGVNAPIGINVFSMIAQNNDIVFQLQDFKNSELDAMIIKYSSKSNRKYIIINSEKSLINQIFAAAHEYYHYLYSFTGNTKDSIVCFFNKNDKEEIKANRFAAEFLLPEDALSIEVEQLIKYYGTFEQVPLLKQILFCFLLVIKYSLPLKAVMYRLKEEKITDIDFMINHYKEIKKILIESFADNPYIKELYSKSNMYINEQLYDLVPFLYNSGRLDDTTVNEIIKKFSLSEAQIKESLIRNE